MPGPHKREPLAEGFQLRAQEMIDIKILEFQVGFLDEVWAVVSAQKKSLSTGDIRRLKRFQVFRLRQTAGQNNSRFDQQRN